MLSILIPTYNYDCFSLVKELKKQADTLQFDYEILVQDDCSSLFIEENSKINLLDKCSFNINSSNLGRTNNRLTLVNKSSFELLLFLDSDVFPKDGNFLKKYISEFSKSKIDVVFGGIVYKEQKPEINEILRWVYGKERESLTVCKRLKKPYKTVFTSNLLIKKNIYRELLFNTNLCNYGYEDFVISQELKSKNILIHHIDNPVFHLNLETSAIFLDKIQVSLQNLKIISLKKSNYKDDSQLLYVYNFVKKVHLTKFINFIFNSFKIKMENHLLSNNPKIIILDLYKLGYYCKINLE